MKLTKSHLKQLIEEELAMMTESGGGRPYDPTVPGDWQRQQAMISGEYPEPTSDPKDTLKDAIHEFAAAYGTDDAEALKQELINIIDDALPDILQQY